MNFFGSQGGPGGIFPSIAGGMVGGNFVGARPPPRAYDEYFKAYSVAMLPGRERENVSYGGKIIMPPSALANLTGLDLESPWMFQLRNPANQAATTHSGVLEFIAEEGVVHLPYWMMKTLRLNEGDPIRVTGAELSKGKFVKLQAQTVHFLEISDPKAVLEQALRNFTCLTQGDIIEISYNSIVFGLLVMETKPGGEGISVLDTDLEVDFAAPVGYVEPERPKAPPPATMASKMKIDLDSASPGSSRPGSSLAGGFTAKNPGTTNVSKDGDQWESFKGRGETLGGRKTKGKGKSQRAIEDVSAGSKIYRTDEHRIVTNDTLESNVKVPAALNLPFGKLFFGYSIPPYEPKPKSESSPDSPQEESASFGGAGQALSGRSSQPSAKGKEKEKDTESGSGASASWSTLGSGNTLGSSAPRELGQTGAGGARVPRPAQRTQGSGKQKERSPSSERDWGVDSDEEDVIMIDSD